MRNQTKILTMFLLALGLLTIPAAAQGQSRQPREGLWGGLGMGWGSIGCRDCDSRVGGLSGGLVMGGTIGRKVLIGAGTNGWTKADYGGRLYAASFTVLARFYPSGTGGFFLLGGLGLGTIYVSISEFGNASDTGSAVLAGLGYDIRLLKQLSVTPFWNGVSISAPDADANFGQIGVGFTVH